MATIRKHRGHFLEDFRPGDLYRHKGGKTVTEGLFALFTDFSMTTNPLSKNARYARAYGFRDLMVPPGLVMLVVFSQSVEDVSENARANLEYIDMRFGAPVYIGDTLEAETRVLGVKGSSSNPMLGVVHVQTTGRNQDGEVVLTFQRKVQVWKRDKSAALHDGEAAPETIDATLGLPAWEASRRYADLAHLTNDDSYFEDFTPGDVLEHSRGRVVTTDHIMLTGILDNTSQVHCNQWMVEQEPERYVGGKLIVFGGIPFNLCLGISSADVGDNSLGDVRYITGRHTAPIFAGDTVFASTEVRGVADMPGRPDLGILSAVLRGHKFARKGDAVERVEIFYLERELALKRRSHYAT
ncbi:MAG TPA: MaoC family dehydratase [Candidatus Binatia bacterium]|jgi:2-methylfumaryl-CoA hydratase|nr:MaoC family dehydratase [Candidatus Binatia bacterium]